MQSWANSSKGLGKKRGISTPQAFLVTQSNQLTMGIRKFAPTSRTGTISIFLKHYPEIEFQKVISKTQKLFFFYQ